MLWEVLVFTVIFWCIQFRWQRRHIIQCAKQFTSYTRSWPIIGHAQIFFGNGEDMIKGIQDLGQEVIKQGGVTALWIGYTLYIVVAEPKTAEWALATCLEKDDAFRVCRSVTGEIIFLAPVPIWRNRRRQFTPAFSPLNLSRFVDVFARHAQALAHQLQTAADKGPKALSSYVINYLESTFLETTFGVSLSFAIHNAFSSTIEHMTELLAARITKPWLHNEVIYRMTPAYSTFLKHKTTIFNVLDRLLKLQEAPKHKPLTTLLETLIVESSEDPEVNLKGEVAGLFLAGIDTSAAGLGYVLSMLAIHPEVQDKVFQDVTQIMGISETVTGEHLSKFRYLEAVIKESLRLYPPGAIITRKAHTDAIMPDGRTVVRGTNIMINIWAINRNPVYWGQDADQFRPERFLEGPLKHPAQFMTFSYGPRNCIGYKYAMLSMKTALAMIIRRYSLNPGPLGLAPSFQLVTKDKNNTALELITRR